MRLVASGVFLLDGDESLDSISEHRPAALGRGPVEVGLGALVELLGDTRDGPGCDNCVDGGLSF